MGLLGGSSVPATVYLMALYLIYLVYLIYDCVSNASRGPCVDVAVMTHSQQGEILHFFLLHIHLLDLTMMHFSIWHTLPRSKLWTVKTLRAAIE